MWLFFIRGDVLTRDDCKWNVWVERETVENEVDSGMKLGLLKVGKISYLERLE
jgi:hypothetical protein